MKYSTPRERVNLNPGTSARSASNEDTKMDYTTKSDSSIGPTYSLLDQLSENTSEIISVVWR